ncbi:membrane protein [Streptomyces glaucosporus]|uniref:Membrane protein n=1 Tax=Streptomyces glaucosporus TaxID=284044 RepID=A0ABP5V3L5_9ACTN
MPTTRHHINSLRRRRAREAVRTETPGRAAGPARTRPAARPARDAAPARTGRADTRRTGKDRPARTGRRSRPVAPVLLCLLTVVLGGFAGWAHARAQDLRNDPAVRNTALTDTARTSQVKGQTAKAVAALFSYDHTDPAAFEKAAKDLLTGRAVEQHRTLLDDVRARAGKQKAVITTTVTDSAVERIDGDRARVLVYADQSSVSTAKDAEGSKKGARAGDGGTYAGAMLAVDVVWRDGRWLVSGIDTFGR